MRKILMLFIALSVSSTLSAATAVGTASVEIVDRISIKSVTEAAESGSAEEVGSSTRTEVDARAGNATIEVSVEQRPYQESRSNKSENSVRYLSYVAHAN